MNPILFALRRPITVMVGIIAVVLTAFVAVRPKAFDAALANVGIELPLKRMPIDIFPALNLPVIYVCQPYGGMDPAQMEGLLTNYYEYHFLYINGIHHVESRNVQGTALMKLIFHPGTNMAQAMAETINYVNRSRAMMPPGTVPPFVMRFDTGSVPVGYLVFSSETRTIAEISDLALFNVRPMFSALPGVSAPPPFGGSARSIVVRTDPDRLRAYGIAPDDVVNALVAGNTVSPSGNLKLGDSYPMVPTNAMVKDIRELGNIPIRVGVTSGGGSTGGASAISSASTVYLRDIGVIEDAADITTGYSLVNGRRAVYILATKRADASTMSVIDEIKAALPSFRAKVPSDINVSFEFDQSPYVTRAINGLATEGALGAILTGLMVLVFLRDWRSALVVVLNIPLAIAASIVGLWLCGQTINLMTLGGLALAVGILVDEATVEIENIHTQMKRTNSIAWAVRLGNAQTAVPRLLAMLCILAVFVPSFFMQGAARELFVPLSLAVGFSMIASYILSSTFVPVVSTWLLRGSSKKDRLGEPEGVSPRTPAKVRGLTPAGSPEQTWFARIVSFFVRLRWLVVPAYLAVCGATLFWASGRLGIEIFPTVDAGEFRLRFRAPDGTHIDKTEQIALDILDTVKQKVGEQNVAMTLGYIGTVPASFPINSVYHFSRGPEEGLLRIALKPKSGISTGQMKEELRREFRDRFPNVRFSFEPGDIISEVMSFGSPTPIEIAARGGNLAENREYIGKVQAALTKLPAIRDLQVAQSLDYPTVEIKVDREKAGLSGTSVSQVTRSIVTATSSSRFVVPNYWPDPKSGIGYQVQVEIPQKQLDSIEDLGAMPIQRGNGMNAGQSLLLRDVASLTNSTTPGEYDRYNMKREISLTANITGDDLGAVSQQITQALNTVAKQDAESKAQAHKVAQENATAAGLTAPVPKPAAITHELRGQIPPLRSIMNGLGVGLLLAVLVIFLMLSANYQSWRLAFVTVSTVPAVLTGVALSLLLTGSTLNIQSFIGAIMSLGVAMANAILLVTFAEERRRTVAHAARVRQSSQPDVIEQDHRRTRAACATATATDAAVYGATSRLRAIAMTSAAMLAGMLPLALGLGESGQQTAPLGRAVMGGLLAATVATLLVLPAIFAIVQSRATTKSASLDPEDPESVHFTQTAGSVSASGS
ncbi:MAG: efflux RND transporter permease subunit [Planctomycetaceae bacterium]